LQPRNLFSGEEDGNELEMESHLEEASMDSEETELMDDETRRVRLATLREGLLQGYISRCLHDLSGSTTHLRRVSERT
jgi:hypothetical protein